MRVIVLIAALVVNFATGNDESRNPIKILSEASEAIDTKVIGRSKLVGFENINPVDTATGIEEENDGGTDFYSYIGIKCNESRDESSCFCRIGDVLKSRSMDIKYLLDQVKTIEDECFSDDKDESGGSFSDKLMEIKLIGAMVNEDDSYVRELGIDLCGEGLIDSCLVISNYVNTHLYLLDEFRGIAHDACISGKSNLCNLIGFLELSEENKEQGKRFFEIACNMKNYHGCAFAGEENIENGEIIKGSDQIFKSCSGGSKFGCEMLDGTLSLHVKCDLKKDGTRNIVERIKDLGINMVEIEGGESIFALHFNSYDKVKEFLNSNFTIEEDVCFEIVELEYE